MPYSSHRCNQLRHLSGSIEMLLTFVFLFYTAHDDHLRFPIPTPENDWKGFTREWPDDGYALGDYPNLPNISYQRRQHKGWWDWQDRRNFNEPVSCNVGPIHTETFFFYYYHPFYFIQNTKNESHCFYVVTRSAFSSIHNEMGTAIFNDPP